MVHVCGTAVAILYGQAVNYLVIIVKIKCKTNNITNRTHLPWCELISPYNLFFIVNVSPYVTENVSARR